MNVTKSSIHRIPDFISYQLSMFILLKIKLFKNNSNFNIEVNGDR